MDFGKHLAHLGLDFEGFLEVILAWNFSPKRVCQLSFALHFVVLQMHSIFILVSIRDIFLAGLGIPDQRVDYFLFPLQVRALSVTVNSSYM